MADYAPEQPTTEEAYDPSKGAADEDSRKRGRDGEVDERNTRRKSGGGGSKWDVAGPAPGPDVGSIQAAAAAQWATMSGQSGAINHGVSAGSGGGQEVKVFAVSNPVAGGIIGKGGQRIKQIMEMSGARLQLENKSDMAPGATSRNLTLTGSASQIAAAETMVMQIVSEVDTQGVSHTPNAPPSTPAAGSGVTTLSVPNSAVGSIIGRGGSTIKGLIAETGCHIKLQNKEEMHPGQMQREVRLTGNDQQVAIATARIIELVQSAGGTISGSGAAALSTPPANVYSQSRSQSSAPPSYMYGNNVQSIGHGGSAGGQETIYHNEANVGAIIGKGGTTIKKLIQETGCQIQIQAKNEVPVGMSDRAVYLRGNASAIARAKDAINKVLDPYGGYGSFDDTAAAAAPAASTAAYDPYGYGAGAYGQQAAAAPADAAYNPYDAHQVAHQVAHHVAHHVAQQVAQQVAQTNHHGAATAAGQQQQQYQPQDGYYNYYQQPPQPPQ